MKERCLYCNGTGTIACRSRDGSYAFAGPVPDAAKGYFDADCWHCDPSPFRHAADCGLHEGDECTCGAFR